MLSKSMKKYPQHNEPEIISIQQNTGERQNIY